MEEEYKKKFRENWNELMKELDKGDLFLTITDAYHITKMCTKCDMKISDFDAWRSVL